MASLRSVGWRPSDAKRYNILLRLRNNETRTAGGSWRQPLRTRTRDQRYYEIRAARSLPRPLGEGSGDRELNGIGSGRGRRAQSLDLTGADPLRRVAGGAGENMVALRDIVCSLHGFEETSVSRFPRDGYRPIADMERSVSEWLLHAGSGLRRDVETMDGVKIPIPAFPPTRGEPPCARVSGPPGGYAV